MRRPTSRRCAALGFALLATTACVPDPPTEPSPFACAAAPLSLGAGDAIPAMSADGNLVVIQHYLDDDPLYSFGYEVVDRSGGTRRSLGVALRNTDGASFWANPDGTALLIQRYAPLPPGVPEWSRYDATTGAITPLPLGPAVSNWIVQVSADLSAAVVANDTSPTTYRRVSLADGTSTPLAFTTPAGTSLATFSPTLDRGVVVTSGATRRITVIDTATNATVNALDVVPPSGAYSPITFLDDWHLLVGRARPAGAALDPIPSDDAFVVDLTSGATVRVDPGVPWAHTRWATTDGSRSLYVAPHGGVLGNPNDTWIRGGVSSPVFLATGQDVVADASMTLAVSASDRRVTLTCF